MIRKLSSTDVDFDQQLSDLLAMPNENTGDVKEIVRKIIDDVKLRGDQAVLELTNKFDRMDVGSISQLEISKATMAQALKRLDPLIVDALKLSIDRVRVYHEEQLKALGGNGEWHIEDEEGNKLGQLIRPMERVGLYAPGGKASYPSSVIMTSVPARVAGVSEIILMVPTPDGEISDTLVAAAHLCGVDRMFTVGGAQAIAALAYGTKLIPRVDKIVGPGNIFVATAKELVFGQVGIDMVAGPSEVAIVADASANPEWVAMDMFAQAEHDELAQSVLISSDQSVLDSVAREIARMLPNMERSATIAQSLKDRGALIKVETLDQGVDIVNRIAPEHLELAIAEPEKILPQIRFAGAIFLGHHSAEVVGDYTAGPSHVLPTSGTARFASPLGVYDFQVRSSVVNCSARGAITLSRSAAILATQEGLEAHSKSAQYRLLG
ncbi:MAG: histidinol dehydrogenase [Pseudomonadales bacterium]|jgi:histidinol dehydrogenase|nr:histidinol dehydrogenase [Pseudomonadales bacterium]